MTTITTRITNSTNEADTRLEIWIGTEVLCIGLGEP